MAIDDPLDLTECKAWYDPGSISATDGDLISSWLDETANNNDLSSSGALRPTYRDGTDRHHGQPMLDFSDDQLTASSSASLSNATVTYAVVVDVTDFQGSEAGFIVNKAATSAATVALRCLATPTGFDGGVRLAGSTSTFRQVTDDVCYEQGAVIVMITYDGSAVRLYVENKLVATNTVSGSVDTASGILSVGNHPTTTTQGLVGRIGDVVICSILDSTKRTDLYDWMRAKYPLRYTYHGLVSGLSSVQVRSVSIARDDANSQFVMAYVGAAGNVYYATAPYSDPTNWTDSSTLIFTGANIRGACLLKQGSTWYLWYDSTSAGTISVATGSAFTSLSAYGGNPVLSGTGTGNEQYVRHPHVVHDGTQFVMLYDGRNATPTSGVGALWRATSSDGLSWTRDTFVLVQNGEGFEDTDITAPSFMKVNSTYYLAYGGFNADRTDSRGDANHQFLLATSTDTQTWTRQALDPWPLNERVTTDKFAQGNPELQHANGRLYVYYEVENSSAQSRQAWLTIEDFGQPTTAVALTLDELTCSVIGSGSVIVPNEIGGLRCSYKLTNYLRMRI